MLRRLSRFLPAFPYPHYMAFAPLDAWLRMLFAPGAITRIGPRYWPRLAVGLFTSAIGTAITLPERLLLAPILWASRRRSRGVLNHQPGVIVVLGYYRSGTTHLHYLLSCDRRFITPRWAWTLAPVGFVLSWGLLRWFLVPFLSNSRPQDDVAYGPEWPAEDDFALNNWAAASTMPGRMTLPGQRAYSHFSRFHDLTQLTPRELSRWRRIQWAFSWKIARFARSRAILLKSPAHTARIRELTRLYGDNIKFVHLARDPAAVLRSNVAMHARFRPYFLQPHPGDEVIRARIIEEYNATERNFLAESAALPPGTLSRIRYQDLVADPTGELRRAYSELGIKWTPDYERRVTAYLTSVRDYRTASDTVRDKPKADADSACPELQWMLDAFSHDRPARPKVELPQLAQSAPAPRWLPPATIGSLVALICGAIWLAAACATRNRMDWLVWPAGVAIGLAMMKSAESRARTGSGRLGLWAGLLTLLVWVGFAFPISLFAQPPVVPQTYFQRNPIPWIHVWYSTRDGMLEFNNAFWMFLGVMTAFRFASRKHARAPGA